MLSLTVKNFIYYTQHLGSCLFLFGNRNGKKFGPVFAKNRDLSEKNSRSDSQTKLQQPQKTLFPLTVSNKLVAKSLVAVLGLGFIDAGYSGDWSRIGVISKQSEELLKVAAFVVVPLCFFLIFSVFKDKPET